MNKDQFPLLEAETTWFHVFKTMVQSGDIAKLGPYATTVYMVIKAYTNWKTGKSFPDIELIAEKSGISRIQVIRSLKTLEEFGYLTKVKVGRSNHYTLREQVKIYDKSSKDDDKRPVATATWDYLPSIVSDAVAELKNFMVKGDADKLQVVHIENFNLVLQNNYDSAVGKVNFDMSATDLIMTLDDTHPLKKAFLASRRHENKIG